ncbi:MAG TPA: tetratricopeptide repeat protein [Anaeromyxobacteraceae bacterium]|nr:tetratricopeptide repeat protein [Anaeromyxobacteraceae bacterium]
MHRDNADLESKNDEELFAIGSAAAQAGDDLRAAAAFEHLAERFPASRRAPGALYGAGLAWRNLERWDLALSRFRQLAREHTGAEAEEAGFLSAECLYRMGQLAQAQAALDRLASSPGSGPAKRGRALTQRGVVELEQGRSDLAERSLESALAQFRAAERSERLERYYPAKARFYLGEVYRARFLAVNLDPSGKELEHKAQLLILAQARYLDAMRIGEVSWAVAAGGRVGELYEELRTRMLEAPPPAGLDDEEVRFYREQLHRSLDVLVSKAIVAYEETLLAAQRAGVENNFMPRVQEALNRMRQILTEEGAHESSAQADDSRDR